MGNVAASVIQRWRTRKAYPAARSDVIGRLAIGLVIGVLLFVACRQVVVLGHGLAGFANFFYVPRWQLLLRPSKRPTGVVGFGV